MEKGDIQVFAFGHRFLGIGFCRHGFQLSTLESNREKKHHNHHRSNPRRFPSELTSQMGGSLLEFGKGESPSPQNSHEKFPGVFVLRPVYVPTHSETHVLNVGMLHFWQAANPNLK